MDVAALKARDIMKTKVITVQPETTLYELAKLLREKKITGVPVVDRKGKLTGVVSHTDIIRFYVTFPQSGRDVHPFFKGDTVASSAEEERILRGTEEDFGRRKVEDIMTRETFAFHENVSLTEIAKNMVNLHMHRVIIVDEDLNLSGIISTMDLVKLIGDLHP